MGYLLLLLIAFEVKLRYTVATEWNQFFLNPDKFSSREIGLILIILVLFWFWTWNRFIRIRCRDCKSPKVRTIGEEELGRWVGTKRVREDTGSGTVVKRTVSTTFTEMERSYLCENCGCKWTRVTKEEKK